MKKYIPHLVTAVFALWVAADWRTPSDRPQAIPANAFARLPVLSNGRIQPLDSLARNTLLQIREKQSVRTGPGEQPAKSLSAAEWLLEMFFQQELADTRPVFRILHTELKGLLGLALEADPATHSDGKHFSWNQIRDKLAELRDEARRASAVAESARTPFDRAVLQLWNAVGLYMRTQNTVQPQDSKNWERELQSFVDAVPAGREAAKAQQAGQPFESGPLEQLIRQLQRASAMKELAPAMIIPPPESSENKEGWLRVDEVLFNLARGDTMPLALRAYAAMGTAYRGNDPVAFKAAVERYRGELGQSAPTVLAKCGREQLFNHLEPFYKCIILYVTAGLCVMIFTLAPEKLRMLRDTARLLLFMTLAVHSAGLIYRMVLEGRPPVTNLYSSAIFIGWGACVLGLVLERVWKNGIGVLVSSSAGFLTLIIAHNLALGGDTMEMMRAVLDTNFWLATHVDLGLLRDVCGRVARRVVRGAGCVYQVAHAGHGKVALQNGLRNRLFRGAVQLHRHRPRRDLGRPKLGPLLGLGRKGKRGPDDRAMERAISSCALGRDREGARADQSGDFRKRGHGVVVVRSEHAGYRLAFVRLHVGGVHLAYAICHHAISVDWIRLAACSFLEKRSTLMTKTTARISILSPR